MTENATYVVSSTASIQLLLEYIQENSSTRTATTEYDETHIDRNFNSATKEVPDYFQDTSNFKSERPVLEVEKRTLELIAQYEKTRKKTLMDRFSTMLIRKFQNFEFDEESIESVYKVCEQIITEMSVEDLGEILQKIYLSNNDNINLLCGLCQYLISFDLNEVMPWGPMILIGLLNHKNETVKEYAVMLLDNWKDKSLVPVLRNIDCKSKWLQEYIKDVLFSLEG